MVVVLDEVEVEVVVPAVVLKLSMLKFPGAVSFWKQIPATKAFIAVRSIP